MGEYDNAALRAELSATQTSLWNLQSQIETFNHTMREVLDELRRSNDLKEKELELIKCAPTA